MTGLKIFFSFWDYKQIERRACPGSCWESAKKTDEGKQLQALSKDEDFAKTMNYIIANYVKFSFTDIGW